MIATCRLEYLLSFILVFMSSPKRMKNPHLRAELAEMLASLMPIQPNEVHPDKLLGPQYVHLNTPSPPCLVCSLFVVNTYLTDRQW